MWIESSEVSHLANIFRIDNLRKDFESFHSDFVVRNLDFFFSEFRKFSHHLHSFVVSSDYELDLDSIRVDEETSFQEIKAD